MIRGTMLVLWLVALLPAQVVRLHNHSVAHFSGWVRTIVDTPPPFSSGDVNGSSFVSGRQVGRGWSVDVHTTLAAGEARSLDLAAAVPNDVVLPTLPGDLLAHFGGPATVGSTPVEIVGLGFSGAAFQVSLRARVGRMLTAFVWLTWYPSQPGWCTGEALVVASNPAVPDMGEAVPDGLTFRFGDALVAIPGAGVNVPLVTPGTYLADGQGKGVPLVLIWLRHMRSAADWSSVGAVIDCGIGAVGSQALTSTGGPLMPEEFSGRAWAASRFGEAVRRLHTWDPPVCGPANISGSAGEQEDTLLHPGGEALTPDGVGAEWVRYLSAIKLFSERPCNHLEADASWLEPARHPSLLFWDGRVHWHPNVSPDRLGKPRVLTADEAHGRWGPDVQHFYCRTLTASALLKDSPLCQQLLRNLCVVYLLQRTSNPSWSTSQWESAREWGCEGQFVVDMQLALEDRAMAARVAARWRERVERVLLPKMAGKDLLVVWRNDPRVNTTGDGVQWWQESFASWSIDEACRIIGPATGRELAMRIARRVLNTAWTEEDGQWRAQPQGPINGSSNEQNPATFSFNHYGMPLCVAVVLRSEPTNERALAIWTQLMAAKGETARRWMPAGVQ